MKNLIMLLAGVLSLTACSNAKRTATEGNELEAVMSVPGGIQAGSPVMLHFVVHNRSSEPKKFCKWHTPFEGFISSFLDIGQEDGAKVAYHGPMAKRMMPPPDEAYITVPAKDSVSVDIDLMRGYAIPGPGKYKAVYQDGNISGLMKVNEVRFTVR